MFAHATVMPSQFFIFLAIFLMGMVVFCGYAFMKRPAHIFLLGGIINACALALVMVLFNPFDQELFYITEGLLNAVMVIESDIMLSAMTVLALICLLLACYSWLDFLSSFRHGLFSKAAKSFATCLPCIAACGWVSVSISTAIQS